MKTYTKQQAEEQYEKLPRVLREAIFSAEVAEKMYEIGRRNGLNIEKTGFLAEESGYVVLGLTRPNEFIAQITERLEITTDRAKEIAGQVNHEIFFPLHEALKQAHGVDVKEEVIEKAEPLVKKSPSEELRIQNLELRKEEEQPKQEPQSVRPPTPPQPSQTRPQSSQTRPQQPKEGETIDLRQQYRPRMPDLPPSKIPPINLRAQREETQKTTTLPQGGVIPKQGVSFPHKQPINPPPAPKSEPTTAYRPTAATPPAAASPPSPPTLPSGENIKTSPFGISSGKLVEDWEKKMQPAPPEPPPTPAQEKPAESTASPMGATKKEEMLKPPELTKPPVTPPPNIPLKEEMPLRSAKKQDPYREPVE